MNRSSAAAGDNGFQRGSVTRFVARHALAWELGMGLLAVGYLVLGILVDDGWQLPVAALTALGLFFLLEFTVRFLDSPSRLGYLRHHWLDLISCIPLIGGTRSLRLLRLLRLGAAVRVIGVAEAHAHRRKGRRDSLWFIAPLLLIVWFATATAYWELEHGTNPALHSFGDALYWAFITAVTVGYGSDARPVTKEGQILAGILIFFGIGLIGLLSSRLTARVLDVHDDHHEKHAEKLGALEDRLGHIESLLTDLVLQGRDDVAEQPAQLMTTPTSTPRVPPRRPSKTPR